MNDTPKLNVAIVGGGPGGYAAAFLAADLGLTVTLIDEQLNPGGVCLYRGCIPSKALLHVAKLIDEARHAKDWGIEFGEPKIDIDRLRSFKEGVVKKLTGGLGQLSKQRKITYIQGRASFENSNTLKIERVNGSNETQSFDRIVIATGSRPAVIPAFNIGSRNVLDSTGGLALENIPKTMLVVGGGYIGLELGTVYAAMGTKVSVVEMMPGLLPGADRDLVTPLHRHMSKVFDAIMLNTTVKGVQEDNGGIRVAFEGTDVKEAEKVYEKVLVSVGRKPNSEIPGLEKTKVEIGSRGFIQVNKQLQTADPSIYAIGDVVGEPMLAHKASHEGRVAVEHIAGHKVAFEPNAIPAVVFTDPEIAWCGLTETQAEKEGRQVAVAKFPWGASGRAMTLDRTEGMTKLIIDPETERILGMGIVGAGAGELISEGVLAVEMAALATDIKLTIHPHPTLSETVMESAEVFFGQSTHVYRPKR
ncbi:MAG TPA: dihydrolipoyl dehydrogenase [Terriglobales bacterium]|nr:dihydrolipoyl dehydrogenase [Terriglobales bacterium]